MCIIKKYLNNIIIGLLQLFVLFLILELAEVKQFT